MKRLYRSRKNKVIAGVCGGIAEYFEVDPVLIRIIAILFLFTGGASLIAYIVGMIIMPKAPEEGRVPVEPAPTTEQQPENVGNIGTLIVGIILILFGVIFIGNSVMRIVDESYPVAFPYSHSDFLWSIGFGIVGGTCALLGVSWIANEYRKRRKLPIQFQS